MVAPPSLTEAHPRPGGGKSGIKSGSGTGARRYAWAFLFSVFILLIPKSLWAQASGTLVIEPIRDLSAFVDRPITAVEVRTLGNLWVERVELQAVKPGDAVSGELARRALRELDRTGNYAELSAHLEEREGALVFVVIAKPRRIVQQIRSDSSILAEADEERALEFRVGDGVTEQDLKEAADRLLALYEKSGYPQAKVTVLPEEVDDPRRTLVRISIEPGPVQPIRAIQFLVSPSPHHPRLGRALKRYKLKPGATLDAAAIVTANEDLVTQLVAERFYEAQVSSDIKKGAILQVKVNSGPHFQVRVEGNELFSAEELEAELKLAENREVSLKVLEEQLRKFYLERGYLDAYVRIERFYSKTGLDTELYVWVRAGAQFEVTKREFPCLKDERKKRALGDEIDGVLAEQFPSPALIGPVVGNAVDLATTGTPSTSGSPAPYVARPWRNFTASSYTKVIEHLRDYYRAEGYVDARVGPATLVRGRCARRSSPDECIVDEPPVVPAISCDLEQKGPKNQDDLLQTCVPDFKAGVRCEAQATLILPVVPGQQTILYDVMLEGNEFFSEKEILTWANLPLGKPLRREVLDAALRRVVEHYQEEAFAFAQVDSEIELSSDHSRAQLVISIVERKQVSVERVEVQGATETSETLIRSRLALAPGKLYRRSRLQRSEEQLQSLGVFTSVTVGMADPNVPAKKKVVVVQVNEKMPQYLDTKVGFASADGFRIGFEYGHRNLAGKTVHLTLRSQLALRPLFLITEPDVKAKYQELSALQLLERRNTITLTFPDIGLGPLFNFEAELLDLHSNERDYSHSRDAAVLRLLFIPRRRYQVNLGGTVELNDAQILGGESLADYVLNNPGVNIRVPEGRSIAYTQNLGASWDLRDQPLAATEGTYVGASVEHVTAVPLGLGESGGTCNKNTTEVFAPACSELLRFTGKVSGYIPLNKKGLSLAMSLRGGVIHHLTDYSHTYPDRLFFMGGVDSLRGFTQYSLVPQDAANRVLKGGDFGIAQIALRGGDVFINPRLELRVPVTRDFATAIFIDSGNLWVDGSNFNPIQLRYTTGTGLRIKTPVGPLVFDYGFNVTRVLDKIVPKRKNQRSWEALGAFHFSIGLF